MAAPSIAARRTRRILVPTDFSVSAARALDLAVELAKALGAEVVLLHAVALPSHYAPYALVPVGMEWIQAAREEGSARLAQECGRVVGVPITSELREGRPDESILAVADRSFDMIVMGTHGRVGLKHMLLGSVAERVVRHSPIPVLTVRATE